jgi:hypothetical protein
MPLVERLLHISTVSERGNSAKPTHQPNFHYFHFFLYLFLGHLLDAGFFSFIACLSVDLSLFIYQLVFCLPRSIQRRLATFLWRVSLSVLSVLF